MTRIMTRDSSLGPQERGSGYRVQGREGVSAVCPKCGERHDFLGDDYRQWDATDDDDIEKANARLTIFVTAPCGHDMALQDVTIPGYVHASLDDPRLDRRSER